MGRLVRRRNVAWHSPDEIPEAPDPFNFTRDVVELRAAESGRPALRFVDAQGVIDRRTFDDLAPAAGRWASLLGSRGLVPGDRVAVLLGPSSTWPVVLLGALKAGLVVVPCPETTSNDDLELRLRQSDARLLVVDENRAATLEALDAVVDVVVCEGVASELRGLVAAQATHDTTIDDPAVILSRPDGPDLTLSHGALRGVFEHAEVGYDVLPGDRVWCAAETGSAPWVWDGLIVPWAAGAAIVIHGGGFDPLQRLELIQRLGVTVLRQTPDEYRQMVDQAIGNGELDELRRAVSMGDPLDPDVADAFGAMCGLTVEEEPWDRVFTGQSDSPEPATAEAHGLVETLNDRAGSVTTANGSTAPPAALGVAATTAEQAARDEATAEAQRLEDARRQAEQQAAERDTAERGAAQRQASEREAAERDVAEQRRAEEARQAEEPRARAEADDRERRRQEREAAAQARRDEQERKAAAAHVEADARERKRQKAAAAATAQRAAEEERRAAEAKAKADARERKQQEKDAAKQARLAERRAEEERKAAAAQAEADERERKRQEAAAAAAAQRAAEEERRAAKAKAKDDERARKQQEEEAAKEAAAQARRDEEERKAAAAKAEVDERERKRQEAAAAAAAQRAAEEERRAAEAKAKDDERARKQQEEEAAKEAAAQARRDEEERKAAERVAAADRRAAEEAEQRRLAEQARAEAQRQRHEPRPEPVAVAVANGDDDAESDAAPNVWLLERLRAYTHHADDVTADPPPQ